MNAAPAFPPASARNMALLVQLRWMAVFGQLVTIWVARHLFGISLPLVQLVAVPVLPLPDNSSEVRCLQVCRRQAPPLDTHYDRAQPSSSL